MTAERGFDVLQFFRKTLLPKLGLNYSLISLYLGPKIKGGKTWDRFCVYPNLVEMHPGQVDMLKYLVNLNRPTVPFYVCTIQGANTVEGNSKMVSNDYISRMFLHLYMLTMTISEVLHLIICSTSQGSLP